MCIIYAVTHGYLNDISVEQIPEFELQLEEFLENSQYSSVLTASRTTGKLEPETEEMLKQALTQILADFKKPE